MADINKFGELATLAMTIGAKCDEIARKESSWHSNTMQKFLLEHPMALYVIKTIVEDDKAIAMCREKLAGKEVVNTIYKLKDAIKEKISVEDEKEDLIETLWVALSAAGLGVRMTDTHSSDPDRLTRGLVYDSLKSLVWRMKYARCARINPVKDPVLYQDSERVGKFVRIRPCGKEYEGKTFLGIYLGDFPIGASLRADEKSHDVLNIEMSHHNPAIYVPELKKTIFGIESWWGEIEGPEDLKEITDADINNVWYVKAIEELSK